MIWICFWRKNQKKYLKKTSSNWSKNSWKFWFIVLKFVFGSKMNYFKSQIYSNHLHWVFFRSIYQSGIHALSRVGLALDYWAADPIFVYGRNSSFEMTGNISWKIIVDESTKFNFIKPMITVMKQLRFDNRGEVQLQAETWLLQQENLSTLSCSADLGQYHWCKSILPKSAYYIKFRAVGRSENRGGGG